MIVTSPIYYSYPQKMAHVSTPVSVSDVESPDSEYSDGSQTHEQCSHTS